MAILEKVDHLKQRVCKIVQDVLNDGVIERDQADNIIMELQKEKITIGIVGQIKHGKSTLLNAMIFKKPVLPSATTPMTASLSYITYGDKPSVEVEFFSHEDWQRIKEEASCHIDSDIKNAASHLVEQSTRITNINQFLGKTKTIDFSEMKEYVGEGGRFVPITKSLKICYPHPILKGADFVDTPGFNDPVLSREQRAMEFLSRADVVIVLLYAGRPFDASDRELLFRKIKAVGSGKVVMILNKFDMVLDEQGGEEKAKEYTMMRVKEEIRNIEKENNLIASVFQEVVSKDRLVLMSSLWALMGRMDKNEIDKDEDLAYHWDRARGNFPRLKTQRDFEDLSGIKRLEEVIDKIIKDEKSDVLIRKPLTYLLGSYNEKIDKLREQKNELEMETKMLNQQLDKIRKEEEKIKQYEKEITGYVSARISKTKEQVKRKRNDIEAKIESDYKEIKGNLSKIFPSKGYFETHSGYSSKCCDRLADEVKKMKIETYLRGFRDELYEITKECLEDVKHTAKELIYKFLDLTADDEKNLIERLMSLLDEKVNTDFSRIRIETSGWWMFGTGKAKDEAIAQAETALNERMKSDLEQVKKLSVSGIEKLVYLEENFETKVIKPIRDAVKKAIENYKNKESRMQEIRKQTQELDIKITNMEKKKGSLQMEMTSLLEGRI